MTSKLKVPFNPADAKYHGKPTFLAHAQKFVDLCETKYNATRVGQRACSIDNGVSIEYEMVVGNSTAPGSSSNNEASLGRAINFHLILYYKARKDGVSAAHLDDPMKCPELGPLGEDIKSMLIKIRRGPSYSTRSDTTDAVSPPSTSSQLSPAESASLSPSYTDSQLTNNHPLLRQIKSACANAGAILTSPPETGGLDTSNEETSICGRYAGTRFRVSIHGISDADPDELCAVWEEPKNAYQRSVPGIKFLVDALNATIASTKYIRILEHARVSDSYH
jgi:hypothetical protein